MTGRLLMHVYVISEGFLAVSHTNCKHQKSKQEAKIQLLYQLSHAAGYFRIPTFEFGICQKPEIHSHRRS